jgi:hypothetical protein
LWWLLPLRLKLDILAAIHEFWNGKPAMGKAALRGTWDTWRHLRYWLRKAKETTEHVEAARIGPDRTHAPGYYSNSIVWDVFVRRKATWTDVMEA